MEAFSLPIPLQLRTESREVHCLRWRGGRPIESSRVAATNRGRLMLLPLTPDMAGAGGLSHQSLQVCARNKTAESDHSRVSSASTGRLNDLKFPLLSLPFFVPLRCYLFV